MTVKKAHSPRLLIAPRKKRKRGLTQAHAMIQTRMKRTIRHMTASNRNLTEILDIVAEFPPGTFGPPIGSITSAGESL